MSGTQKRRRRGDGKPSPGAAESLPKGHRPSPGQEGDGTPPAAPEPGFLMKMRGWADALVIAYVLAMFIRTYDVELFKIPTGSMTPTLVGDDGAAEVDYDGDGEKDLILNLRGVLQVFLRKNGEYTRQVWVYDAPPALKRQVQTEARPRHDMILVNKFSYWFSPPKRGDIIVFKVPDRPQLGQWNPWNPKTPIFIKRCAGIGGDTIDLEPPKIVEARPGTSGHIGPGGGVEWFIESGPAIVNGRALDDPPVFNHIDHFPFGFDPWRTNLPASRKSVPQGGVFMMGDNSANSTDSRAWGDVPLDNIKGKAIFRYWPLRKLSFLE